MNPIDDNKEVPLLRDKASVMAYNIYAQVLKAGAMGRIPLVPVRPSRNLRPVKSMSSLQKGRESPLQGHECSKWFIDELHRVIKKNGNDELLCFATPQGKDYGFVLAGAGPVVLSVYTGCDGLDGRVVELASLESRHCSHDMAKAKADMLQAQLAKEEEEFARPVVKRGWFNRITYDNPPSFTLWKPKFFSIPDCLKWYFFDEHDADIPADRQVLSNTLPVYKPEFKDVADSSLSLTWLGHATTLVRMGGATILTDPVWSSRLSPVPMLGATRYRKPPCDISSLPLIDIVVISHDHYDHLDAYAVQQLHERFENIVWCVPLGIKASLSSLGIPDLHIYELSWGDSARIDTSNQMSVEVESIPAQHWGRRSIMDTCTRLWCGWAVKAAGKCFYYVGDSGFCREEFKKVGRKFNVDLAAIPIGCYEPEWFLRPQHIGPKEALAIHKIVNAKQSIAVHWGTYMMGSSEGYMEPKRYLEELVALEESQGHAIPFCTLPHGGAWTLEAGVMDCATSELVE